MAEDPEIVTRSDMRSEGDRRVGRTNRWLIVVLVLVSLWGVAAPVYFYYRGFKAGTAFALLEWKRSAGSVAEHVGSSARKIGDKVADVGSSARDALTSAPATIREKFRSAFRKKVLSDVKEDLNNEAPEDIEDAAQDKPAPGEAETP